MTTGSPLLVVGATSSYLEPCGCGGQVAGGLAQRAAVLAELRAARPGLLHLDLGGFGGEPNRAAVIARALAAMGTSACGLGPDDLAAYPATAEALRLAALPATSLTPPLDGSPPPASLVLSAGGQRYGLLSVAFGPLTLTATTAAAERELRRLREVAGCLGSLLISHLGVAATTRLVERIEAPLRPLVVLLATTADQPAEPYHHLGITWVPIAAKGRALALVELGDEPARVQARQHLITDGPRDPAVQGWVDEFYQRQRHAPTATAPPAAGVTEAAPPVAACLPCHEPAVRGWRASAHAGAVETLKQASREVAECLRCHDEGFRRTGVVAPEGDQGVVCASCHGALAAHLRGDGPPTTATADTCLTCHDREHSQQFAPASYLARITAAH